MYHFDQTRKAKRLSVGDERLFYNKNRRRKIYNNNNKRKIKVTISKNLYYLFLFLSRFFTCFFLYFFFSHLTVECNAMQLLRTHQILSIWHNQKQNSQKKKSQKKIRQITSRCIISTKSARQKGYRLVMRDYFIIKIEEENI